jgi:peptidoglycan/LPS O-acetylase OafA/YrhL
MTAQPPAKADPRLDGATYAPLHDSEARRPLWPRWLAETFLLTPSGTERLAAMEGVRGFSILLVFFVHFGGMVAKYLPDGSRMAVVNAALATIGHQGVDLFFIISGYLMYSALRQKPRPFLSFLRRRIQRLYPTFITVFALYVVLSIVFPAANKIPHELAAAAWYLTANALLLPGVFPMDPMITVAWSLSYEMAFYVILPAFITVSGVRSRSTPFRVAVIAVVSLAVMLAFPRLARAAMFGSGMILAEWSHASAKRPGSDSGFFGAISLLAAIPVGGYLFAEGNFATAITPLLSGASIPYVIALSIGFVPACRSAFSGEGILARLFSTRPLRLLGNMSYSYYLLHGVALKGFFLVVAVLLPALGVSGWVFWALLAPAFLTTFVASAVLFVLVERRFSIVAPRPALTY